MGTIIFTFRAVQTVGIFLSVVMLINIPFEYFYLTPEDSFKILFTTGIAAFFTLFSFLPRCENVSKGIITVLLLATGFLEIVLRQVDSVSVEIYFFAWIFSIVFFVVSLSSDFNLMDN